MAITNKGSKWEMKNSFVFIWAFFPILSCITFLNMNSRVKNKKWSIMGWFSIIINMILILAFVIPIFLNNPNEIPYYYEIEQAPKVIDYMNSDQKKLYYEDSSYENSTEFKITEEYSKYEAAFDQWDENRKKWEKQPEIAAQIEKYRNYDSTKQSIIISAFSALFVIYIIFLIIALTDRPKYLKLLEQSENKSSVTSRINSVRKNSLEKIAHSKKTEVKLNDISQLDINSASEEELSALQGLTVVDAKKAVSYRSENNGFNSIDEFFTCINAKPHIIVALEKQLIVGEYKFSKSEKAENSGKRMLDL